MTIRIGYVGPTSSPEFAALRTRKNATVAAVFDPEEDRGPQVAEEIGALAFSSPGALVSGADVGAVVLNLPPSQQAEATLASARRGLAVFVVPPMAPSYADGLRILESVERDGIVTSVGWPMRYAINLIQIRQHVGRVGAQWMMAHVFAGQVTAEELLNRAAGACDLIRYIGGPVTEVEDVRWRGQSSFDARIGLASGGEAHLVAVTGAKVQAAEETSIEVFTDGDRMAWYHGSNHTVINGQEQRVAEKVDGLFVAEIAAFLTAIETGWRSPILCGYAEGVETLAVTDRLRQGLKETA